MTIRSDIAAHDGPQLGRAPLIAPHEQRTLANASKLVRTLGDVPLAHHLEALSRRLSGPSDQRSALVPEVPENVSGLNGFTSFPANPSDEMTECPHCHGTQMVDGDESGISQGCACLSVEYRRKIGLPC